jgi:hypothetical protein
VRKHEAFDVYVSEGVMVEVHRGRVQTVARQFGADFDGPIQTVLHGEAFEPSVLDSDGVVCAAPSSAASRLPEVSGRYVPCVVLSLVLFGVVLGWLVRAWLG